MNGWERFNEALPAKTEFYSNLTIEDITDESYKYARQYRKILN